MLMLRRKVEECVWVGDTRVVLTQIKGKQVQLGFDGPRDVPIVRGELRPRPPEENPPPQAEAA